MAEALARAELTGKVPNFRCESAGLGALVGHPADPLAIELLKERGIDLSTHAARQLTTMMVRDFELILVMEGWQVKETEKLSPLARGKVWRLGHWRDFDIPDPYKRPREAFERTLDGIERGLADLKKMIGVK